MKAIKGILITIIVLCAMYTEYRVIMLNAKPYIGESNTVYIEVFGMTDEYYAERVN